jgi:UDP-3-O-[3-hydroxymyristoyl] glucosamine N-acyltransferase
MAMTAKELASRIGGTCDGDGDVLIHSIASIREAIEGQLTFVANSKYLADVQYTRASAILAPPEFNVSFRPVIRVNQPRLALIKAMELLTPAESRPISLNNGIHPLAFIGENVEFGTNVHVGPFAVIEDNAKIGADTLIYPGVYIGSKTRVGSHCQIHANVTIREGIQIGNRVIIHSGTVVGCDGFGYTEVDGKQYKVPQLGTVVIDDDVEIGANVTIDRATFGKTWIKSGTKIDNLVQIAHNVIIGEHCIIAAQTGIAGSTELENLVTLAGQVAVTGHIKIGHGTKVTGRSAVSKDIPPNVIISGHPAKPIKEDQKIKAHLQRLPNLSKRVHDLEKQVESLLKLIHKQTSTESGDEK